MPQTEELEQNYKNSEPMFYTSYVQHLLKTHALKKYNSK